MTNNSKNIEYENVNGIPLTLKVNTASNNTKLRNFVISFTSKEKKSSWPKTSLIFAIVINILAFNYVRISLTTIVTLVVVFTFLLFFWITHSVQSESLLVIPTVGIQSSVKYVCGKEDHFFSWSNIDDIIINEVIKLNRVLYFLTVIVKNDNSSNQESDGFKLVPLFKYTKPRLMMLETVYNELQSLLMETQHNSASMAAGDTVNT